MECRRGNNKKKGIVVSNSFVFVFGLIINNWWFRLAQRRAPEAKAKSIIFVNPLSQFAGGFLIPKTIEKRQLWKWYQGMACFCFLLFASIQLCRSKFTGRLLFPFCSTLLLVQNQNPLFFSLFLGKIILQHFCFISLFEPLLFVICYLLHDGHWIYYENVIEMMCKW